MHQKFRVHVLLALSVSFLYVSGNELSETIITAAQNTINFLQIGDWGGRSRVPYITEAQVNAVVGMDKIARNISAEFIIGSGDNFYNTGVKSVDDSKFNIVWSDIYNKGSYIKDLKWYQIAGNHDYEGNVQAQIEYSSKSENWIFPSPYYKRSFISGNGEVSIDILFLDSMLYTGVINKENYPQKYIDDKQHDWIVRTMAESKADYLLINNHYPIYSPSDYGNVVTNENHILPLLHEYGAHYFSGHEHCLVHMTDEKGTNYWLNGIGAKCCYTSRNLDKIPENVKIEYMLTRKTPELTGDVNGIQSGFSSIIVTKDEMRVKYHDQDGNVLHESFVLPRKMAFKSNEL